MYIHNIWRLLCSKGYSDIGMKSITGFRFTWDIPTSEIKQFNSRKVLDIGCGNGRNMIFPYSIGIDLDRKILKQAKKHGEIILADARYLPFRDKSFDLSLLCFVLNFVSEPGLVYAEASRVSQNTPYLSLYPAKNALWRLMK